MRQCQRVLNTITEQIPVRQLCQRVMKCQLSQFLLERLALADVVKIEREPAHRRVVRQVAADNLQHEALETVFHAQFDRADRSVRRRGDLCEECPQHLDVRADPEVEKILPDDVLRFQAQHSLRSGRREAHYAVRRHDHDDIGSVRDQRRVAVLDHPGGSPLAIYYFFAHVNCLARHQEQHKCEHDDGHHGRRTPDIAVSEGHEHEKRG